MNQLTPATLENASAQSPIAFSVGHAYKRPGEKLEQIIARADAAMYDVKGRHQTDRERRRSQTNESPATAALDDSSLPNG